MFQYIYDYMDMYVSTRMCDVNTMNLTEYESIRQMSLLLTAGISHSQDKIHELRPRLEQQDSMHANTMKGFAFIHGYKNRVLR
jgi:hypothetical protein